ncbi:MAG TPA: ABC transporter ATP-binding protein [Armatimonadota bacterium]|jgi:ABC-type lipoprotein export system ATPase subunit
MSDKLTVDGVSRVFPGPEGPVTVLREVSLAAQPGDTVALVGPSGSGKSTLLNLIGSLDQPTSGQVRLGDTVVAGLQGPALAAFRARRVGFVFQDHHLLPQLSALENALLPTLTLPRGERPGRDRALELLTQVGVQARAHAFPAQLSGGERQRVAVARALINGAGLLLCDEPTGNLDQTTGAAVVSLLLELAQAGGVTVLMVTHNLEQAARFGRVLRLENGTLVPTGGAA